MPRWALAGLLLAFIVPGLFGHDLWPQDATGFGRMWTMAHGTASDWLLQNVAGAPELQGGPLPYWFGALLIRAGGAAVGEVNAAAAANLVWIPLAALALWIAVYRLARRDEAQPVVGAFGGQAKRSDYARLLADIAVLVMVGTLGVLLRLHQTQSDGASVAIVALALLATSLVEWRWAPAAILAGLCSGALALTLGPVPATGLLLGCAGAFCSALLARGAQAQPLARRLAAAGAASALLLGAAALGAGVWPLAAALLCGRDAALGYFDAWRAAQPLGWPGADGGAWLLRTGAWFLWPLWPLAAWASYAWRTNIRAAHLARPLLVLAGLGLSMLVTMPLDERALVLLIPPLAVLAAFGATTLRRALDNVIDWFAMAVFSLALAFFWGYYAAMQTGAPKAMAASVARLVPGYTPHVQAISVVLALAAAIVWIQLIAWRVLRRPRVLWRGPMLAAAGVTVLWITAVLLFLPTVNYLFSYRGFAIEVAAQLNARGLGSGCVQAHRIPPAERAMLAYYGRIRFGNETTPETCRFALHREARRSALDEDPPPGLRGAWELSWEGRRRVHPDERWRIWTRAD